MHYLIFQRKFGGTTTHNIPIIFGIDIPHEEFIRSIVEGSYLSTYTPVRGGYLDISACKTWGHVDHPDLQSSPEDYKLVLESALPG